MPATVYATVKRVVAMLTAEQVPYTGMKGSDATKHDHDAPTIEALKRAMVRLGYLSKPLSELDTRWPADGAFDDAFGRWSLAKGFNDDHVYGEGKWEEIRRVTIPPARPTAANTRSTPMRRI